MLRRTVIIAHTQGTHLQVPVSQHLSASDESMDSRRHIEMRGIEHAHQDIAHHRSSYNRIHQTQRQEAQQHEDRKGQPRAAFVSTGRSYPLVQLR